MRKEIKAEAIPGYLAAGYSGFIIKTAEPARAAKMLSDALDGAKRKDGETYSVMEWNVLKGKKSSPMDALEDLTSEAGDFTCAILHNFHWFIDTPPVIQKIQNEMDIWRNQGKALIILSPEAHLPIEIRKDFMSLELPLPDEGEIRTSMKHISDSARKPDLMKGDLEPVVQAAKGLTQTEIENVLALSFTSKGCFDVKTINEQKIQTIEKSGLIEVLRTDRNYSDILGYEKGKRIVSKMIKKRTSKGVLFAGPPGCGKTLFMECTVGEFDKIGLLINFGRLYSKFQGEGSNNVEEIIDVIEAVGDCVVIMDEFEKQFAGAGSSGDTDSGTARRMTGRWLQFMQEKPEGVYMMGTCNSFKGIPDEYLRVGRWDSSPFFIDMPNELEKLAILDYYVNKLKLDVSIKKADLPKMEKWTGAEIEGMCGMSMNMDCSLKEAANYIVPQNKRGFAEADALREFCIDASDVVVKDGKRRLDVA